MGDNVDGGCMGKLNLFNFRPQRDEDEIDYVRTMESVLANTQISEENFYYKMDHRKRGYALIFNHKTYKDKKIEERQGDNDVKRLLANCNEMGFKCESFTDLEYKEIKREVQLIAKKNFKDCDCVMVFIMTHGTENDMIYAYDRIYDPRELWTMFKKVGKPTLFFINSCRGCEFDDGILTPPDQNLNIGYQKKTEPIEKIHQEFTHIPDPQDHLLVMWASPPHHVAWKQKGCALLMQTLCNKLEQYRYKENLLTILTFVSQEMAMSYVSDSSDPETTGKKQVGCYYTYLTKLLKFTEKK